MGTRRAGRRRAAAAGRRLRGQGGATGSGGTGGIKVGNPQCSDGIDNDGDGKIDCDDPECVGPLDNDESSFATGIPGDNMDACKQDCFFDGNSGMGDDDCQWQLKCDPKSVEPKCPYDQQYADQHTTDARCRRRSRSLRRQLPQAGAERLRLLRLLPDPGRADAHPPRGDLHGGRLRQPGEVPACTQVTQCSNPCDHCEICIGKPTLPSDCTTTTPDAGTDGPPPPNNCGSDFVPCGPGTPTSADGCGPNYGCITGCCIPTGIQSGLQDFSEAHPAAAGRRRLRVAAAG